MRCVAEAGMGRPLRGMMAIERPAFVDYCEGCDYCMDRRVVGNMFRGPEAGKMGSSDLYTLIDGFGVC